MNSFKSIKSVLRVNRLVNQSGIKVAFYDRYAVHHTFSKSIARTFLNKKNRAIFLVGDLSHPWITDEAFLGLVFYIPDGFEIFLRYLRIALIVTPASDFDVAGKNKHTKVAHFFHSPVSMHYVYGDTSFDAYDIFFPVGPHHSCEIKCLAELRGWKNIRSYPGGYPKIDEIVETLGRSLNLQEHKTRKQVMFAPSWGKGNVLRSHGVEIVRGLLDTGFDVKLRPHNHSFKYEQDIIKRIVELFKEQSFELDKSMGFEVLLTSDLLISDWSGIAYEYAFSTGKPVVFVNVEGGQKIQSIRNKQIQLPPMEDICRYELGSVCKPEEVTTCVNELLGQFESMTTDKVSNIREKYLYNFGHSAAEISKAIVEISTGQPRVS